MLTAYKLGWKTSYYQNTYDFKGEEEDVQPAGLDVEPAQLNNEEKIKEQLADLEDDETCDACAI